MKVTVSSQRIGWHKYPGHPKLGNLHRHIFYVWVTFDEKRSREVEFFEAQEEVQGCLDDLKLLSCDESGLSCEDIGLHILRAIGCHSCVVSEDKENFIHVNRADLVSNDILS